MKEFDYDVAIIGAGNAGIFAAYEINRSNPDLSIIILEQGKIGRAHV